VGLADALRAAVAEALQRRAAAHEGEARQLIEQRVQRWQGERLADTRPPAASAASGGALAGLSALVDRLGRATATPVQAAAPARAATPAPRATAARATTPAPLKSVAAFQHTWSRLRAEQRLRQALAQVPAQAGPLNSSHLVHQVLREMHRLSPAYLDAFMAHVDTLLRLEQDSGGAPRPLRKG
jgi:hypothetical protein